MTERITTPFGAGSTADEVIARIRKLTANEPGAALYLVPVQDIRVGGRASNAQWQYTLQSDNLQTLRDWEPKIRNALTTVPELVDVNTDAQDKGLQTSVFIDRATASPPPAGGTTRSTGSPSTWRMRGGAAPDRRCAPRWRTRGDCCNSAAGGRRWVRWPTASV